jgi:hypothetical protein
MRRPAFRLCSVPIRAIAVASLISTLLFAFYLSVAPHAHERIHADAGKAAHECVVTMFASGNCEHAACDEVPLEAKPLPPSAAFLPQRLSIFIAPLEMSVLEHAPPAHS